MYPGLQFMVLRIAFLLSRENAIYCALFKGTLGLCLSVVFSVPSSQLHCFGLTSPFPLLTTVTVISPFLHFILPTVLITENRLNSFLRFHYELLFCSFVIKEK